MIRTLLVVAATVAAASPALALDNGFSCTNEGLVEVQCVDAGCTVASDGFTPLTIEIPRIGQAKVCVKEGCWEGGAASYKYVDRFAFFGLDMQWSGEGERSPDFAMVIQPSGVGSIIAGPYVGPVKCTVTD